MNIFVIRVPQMRRKKMKLKTKQKTITKNLPNLTKNINVQIQEARKSNSINPETFTLRHFIVKFLKTKGKYKS